MEEQQKVEDDFNEADKVKSDLKLWDYKDNKTLIGVVTAVDEAGTYGRTIKVDTEGEVDITIPSLTALNTKLIEAKVGDRVKIVNLGLVKSKNKRDYYDFDVFVKHS